MIQIGGTIDIQFKKEKFKFGKGNYTGRSEKNVIVSLFKELYNNDEDAMIKHILNSKHKKTNLSNLKGIAEVVHNYQFSSKEVSDFVIVFKSLNTSNRKEVLNKINIRNIKRNEDCQSYTVEDPAHRALVDVGINQYQKLERIHDLLELPKESKLHRWISPTPIIKKNRLSKKEKKALKKQATKERKSKKKKKVVTNSNNAYTN
jgi:hypothetical protein